MQAKWLVTLSMVLLLGGCGSGPKQAGTEMTRAVGEAMVRQVNTEQGYVTLDTRDGPRAGWWDQTSEFYRNGKRISYVPRVGDKLEYHGLESHGEIYIRRGFLLQK